MKRSLGNKKSEPIFCRKYCVSSPPGNKMASMELKSQGKRFLTNSKESVIKNPEPLLPAIVIDSSRCV